MAPEYAIYGQFSVKSDIYSFGVLVLEILSGKNNTLFFQQKNNVEDLRIYVSVSQILIIPIVMMTWSIWNGDRIWFYYYFGYLPGLETLDGWNTISGAGSKFDRVLLLKWRSHQMYTYWLTMHTGKPGRQTHYGISRPHDEQLLYYSPITSTAIV